MTEADQTGPVPYESETCGKYEHVLVVINPLARIDPSAAIAALQHYAPPDTKLVIQMLDPGRQSAGANVWDGGAFDLAIAVGGDGTVSTVAATALVNDIPLGIVPGGSTNMVAKVNGVPGDPDQAAALIFGQHRVERIDVGESSEGRLLLHLGGAGLDADVFRHSRTELKRHLGWMAYFPAAVRSLPGSKGRFRVQVDDAVFDGPARMVLIANSAELISADISIYPQVSRTDGLFDVLVFSPNGPIDLAQLGLSFVTKSMDSARHLTVLRGRHIRVDAEPERYVELDGDLAGRTPLSLTVIPAALDMICGIRLPGPLAKILHQDQAKSL